MSITILISFGFIILGNSFVFAESSLKYEGYQKISDLEFDEEVGNIAVNYNTKTVYVSSGFVRGIEIVDAITFKKITNIPGKFGSIVVNSATNKLYAQEFEGNQQQRITAIDLSTNKVITKISLPSGEYGISLQVDEKTNKIMVQTESSGNKENFLIDENTNQITKASVTNIQDFYDREKKDVVSDLIFKLNDNSEFSSFEVVDKTNNKIRIDLNLRANSFIPLTNVNKIFFTEFTTDYKSNIVNKLYYLETENLPNFFVNFEKNVELSKKNAERIKSEKKKTEDAANAEARAKAESEARAKYESELKNTITYSDKKIGFSFKYPSIWTVEDHTNNAKLGGSAIIFKDKHDSIMFSVATHLGKFTPAQHLQHFDYTHKKNNDNMHIHEYDYSAIEVVSAVPININGYFVYKTEMADFINSAYSFTNDRGSIHFVIEDRFRGSDHVGLDPSVRESILNSLMIENGVKWNPDDYNIQNKDEPYEIPSWLSVRLMNGFARENDVSNVLTEYLCGVGVLEKSLYKNYGGLPFTDWKSKLMSLWQNDEISDNDLVIAYQYAVNKNSIRCSTYEYVKHPQNDFVYKGDVYNLMKKVEKSLPKDMRISDMPFWIKIDPDYSQKAVNVYTNDRNMLLMVSIFKYDGYGQAKYYHGSIIYGSELKDGLYEKRSTSKNLQDHCETFANPIWSSIICGRGNMLYSVTSSKNIDVEKLITVIESDMK